MSITTDLDLEAVQNVLHLDLLLLPVVLGLRQLRPIVAGFMIGVAGSHCREQPSAATVTRVKVDAVMVLLSNVFLAHLPLLLIAAG